MTEKERLDKIAELKSQMRSMLDTAVKEERDMNDSEQETFDKLDSEVRMHMNFFRANEMTPTVKTEERKIHDIFGENLRNAVDSGAKKVRIEVRADPENVNIDSTDVADTIPVLFKDIVHALAPNTIIEKVGSKMLFGVQGQPTWPTVGDVAAQWAGENEALLDATIDFDAIKATPNRLGVKVKVSRRALNQSNLDLYNIVVSKIGRAFAAKLNQAMVSLTQVAINAPEGVFVAPALNAIVLSEKPTFEEVVSLETAVLNENVGGATQGFGAYIIGTAMQGKLKTTPIDLNGDNMILQNGEMNGYPVIVSNYMDEDSIGFGFFEYSVVSQFGDMNLIFDPYTQASTNEVVFVANSEFDITVLRPEAFVIGQIPQTT